MMRKFLLVLLFLHLAGTCGAVTLIQRSIGFNLIDWEEGHCELELGDVNGDGHLDLLSVGDHGNPNVNSTEHGIICYLGDGLGTWTAHQYGNFGYGGTGLGDLNRDGFLDIAWGIHHDWPSSGLGSKLLGAALGNGTGVSWTQWDAGMPSAGEDWGMFATDLADFDGDGWLDLISESFGGSNGIHVYRNHGDGTWSHAFGLPGGSVSYTIETGDFNADGWLDFAGTRSTGSVYLGDGEFGFTLHQSGIASGIYAVDVGDFDGDGRDDLLIDHGSSGVKAWRLSPLTETWEEYSSGLPTTNAEQVQFGDLDGDGHLDVVTYAAPTGRCYLSDGAGNWTADASWSMPTPGGGNALRVDGDVDHDGREDIAVLAVMSGFPFYRNQLRVYSPWESPSQLAARVVKPNGGETLRRGSIRMVRWAASVPGEQLPARVDLYLSTNGPSGPWTPIAVDLPDNGRYEWQVMGEVSDSCFIEVRVATGVDVAIDRSDAAFSIGGGDLAGVPPIPVAFRLYPNYPNPFNPVTTIRYDLPEMVKVRLRIFDPGGRLVRVLVSDDVQGPGSQQVVWDGRDEGGRQVGSGVYFYCLEAGGHAQTARAVLIK